jgi:uncharacterized protein (DUF2164 family)
MRIEPLPMGCGRKRSEGAVSPIGIEIPKEARKQAIASIERYFLEKLDEKFGNITAGALLGFFLEEIAPTVYNQAVSDVQERIQARVMEVDIEVHEDAFGYWRKNDAQRKGRKTAPDV